MRSLFLVACACAALAAARPLAEKRSASQDDDYTLFQAAQSIADVAGTDRDVLKLSATLSWAPIAGSVEHVLDDQGYEVSDVYTVRVRFAEAPTSTI